MRSIDADALIEFIENRYEITWESDTYEGGIKDACVDILEKIKGMLTFRPERKKGKWINGGRIIRCSKCKIGYATVKGMKSALTYNFCPNCGADMRGGTE